MLEQKAQLRGFCHINEFTKATGATGLANLRQMIAFCEPLALWSPSLNWMEHNNCQVEPEELLYYIKTGHVRVFGRENWLTDENYRNNHPWKEGAPWSGYDQQLLDFYNEDLKKKPEERRVCAAPNAQGSAYAGKEMANQHSKAVVAAKELIENNRIPGDWGVRIKEKMSLDDKVKEVLRHAHNNVLALKEAQSDLMIFPTSDSIPPLFVSSAGEMPDYKPDEHEREEREQFLNAGIKILYKLQTFRNAGILSKFMKSPHRKELVWWFDKACEDNSPLRRQNTPLGKHDAEVHMASILHQMIKEGLIDDREGVRAVIPEGLYNKAKSAIEIASGIMAAFFVPGGLVYGAAPLAIQLADITKTYLEATSRLPVAAKKYSGIQAPFLAQTGKGARLNQIKLDLNEIEKLIDQYKKADRN